MLHQTKAFEVSVLMKNLYRKNPKVLYFDLNSPETDMCVKDQTVPTVLVL